MSSEKPEDPDAPVWGADGWPRPIEGGLDEEARLKLQKMLELTPLERLQTLAAFVNGIEVMPDGRRPADYVSVPPSYESNIEAEYPLPFIDG